MISYDSKIAIIDIVCLFTYIQLRLSFLSYLIQSNFTPTPGVFVASILYLSAQNFLCL